MLFSALTSCRRFAPSWLIEVAGGTLPLDRTARMSRIDGKASSLQSVASLRTRRALWSQSGISDTELRCERHAY